MRTDFRVRTMLRNAGADAGARLTFFAADLGSDAGWREAVAGCEYVVHVASPLSDSAGKSEEAVVGPARDGSLRVLRAARDANVKRVVMTSSCGAVYYGYPPRTRCSEKSETRPARKRGACLIGARVHEKTRSSQRPRASCSFGLV